MFTTLPSFKPQIHLHDQNGIFLIKCVIAKLEYLSWYFSFSPLSSNSIIFVSRTVNASRFHLMRQHFNTLFREADCCEDEEIKRSTPLAVIPKVLRESNKLHLFCPYTGIVFLSLNQKKSMSMTFSTLLTSPATCHCLWREMSFVSTAGLYCTSSPNVTLNSVLEGDNVAADCIKIKISVT